MVREFSADIIDHTRAECGEGPTWDSAENCLLWLDIPNGQLYFTEADGTRRSTMDLGTVVGAAMPAEGGGWLLAARNGFLAMDTSGVQSPVLDVNAADQRFNDAKCDPRGRAFAGSVADGARHAGGTLYRLDPGPVAAPVVDGVTISNGLGWSSDQRTMYYIDSRTQEVRAFAYDPDTGAMGEGRVLVRIETPGVLPDGMCVDDEDHLWVALWGAGAVHRYTPTGELDAIVRVPAQKSSSCCFGGPDGDLLFITSATEGYDEAGKAADPHAGKLFVTQVGVTGPPATPWKRI